MAAGQTMAEAIAPSQTSPQSRGVREPASPRGPETDVQPLAMSMGQQLPGILRRAKRNIGLLAPAEILTLQRTIGNHAVTRLIAGHRTLQAKLTIGAPDDVYEKEADAVASQVMSRSSILQRKCACGGGSEEECPDCRMKRLSVQRLSSGGDAGLEAPPMVEDVLSTPGQPLAESARQTLEPGFGHDFSHVRVHEGSRAAESAAAVNAVAYTVGHHIVFGQGQYAPGTAAGQHLLAHELTHTIQQTGGSPLVQRDSDPQDQTPPSAPADQTPDDSGPVSLPPITVSGTPKEVSVEGGCNGLSLHGQTDANFDGGTGKVANQVVSKGTCDCGEGGKCFHVTGTLVTKYSVSVTITMPPMPSGLTACEQGKVQDFLKNVLTPHEQDHKTRFMTYNGQTRNPVDVTGCSQEDVQSKVQAIQDAEEAPRQAKARALSAAIDPFVRTVDCSDCKAAPSDAGPGAKPDAGNS
jgi:hypothetical protein